jgi:hypothetical protein
MFCNAVAELEQHGGDYGDLGNDVKQRIAGRLHAGVVDMALAAHGDHGSAALHLIEREVIYELALRWELFGRMHLAISSVHETELLNLKLVAAHASAIISRHSFRSAVRDLELTERQLLQLGHFELFEPRHEAPIREQLTGGYEALAIRERCRRQAVEILERRWFGGHSFLLTGQRALLRELERLCEEAVQYAVIPAVGGRDVVAIQMGAHHSANQMVSEFEQLARAAAKAVADVWAAANNQAILGSAPASN